MNPEAARVGGTTISKRDFERDLNALITNDGFRKAVPAVANSAHDGFAPATLTRTLLSLEIRQALVSQLAKEKNIAVPGPADSATVQAAYGFDDATWTTLPPGLQNRFANAVAEQDLLLNAITAQPTDAEAQAFYDSVKDQVNGLTLEQVRPQIDRQLRGQEFQAAMADAANKVGVRVDPQYGAWDSTQGAVVERRPPTAGQDRPSPAPGQ